LISRAIRDMAVILTQKDAWEYEISTIAKRPRRNKK
jgi:hypothetical protein